MGERTRRVFLRETGGLIAGASLSGGWVRAAAQQAGPPGLEAFPLAGLVEAFRRNQLRPPPGWRETKAQRGDYLEVVAGIVRFFAALQDTRGAIIDPHEKREKQYATPAFALAAAVLHASGHERGLLDACLRAMDRASADLAAGAAADGHPDFYTFLLMHADRALGSAAPPERRGAWQGLLAGIAPERIYRSQPGDPSPSNWNLVAATGEWLRHRAGLAPDTRWIEASLARQLGQLTGHGMYRDPGDPLAYDHFARLHLTSLLDEGYGGPQAAALAELLERGAWTSLFMQSPRGELPCGGRSGLHQWNEAQQAMTFEVQARRLMRRGDHAAAGAFKRAAHLALQSVGRWVRSTGELWIVKNRVEPAARHGYEPYSFHSQYNLLTAAHLALAYLAAEDRIPERPCPAEVGGFAFELAPAFHKIFLNAAGLYVEMETAGDARYNPTGILRVHHAQFDPQLLSDGATPAAAYALPRRPTLAAALAPAWRDGAGGWHSLAGLDGTTIRECRLRVDHASPERVECEVVLRGALPGGASAVRQSLFLTPKLLTVTATVDGEVFGVRQTCPLLLSDGREDCVIDMSARTAAVRTPRGGGLIFEASGPGAASMSRLGVSEPTRAGFVDLAVAETAGKTLRCVLRPIGPGAGRR